MNTLNRTPARSRRRVGRALITAALAACALPAAASAATVELASDGTLNYRGASGETNNLAVIVSGSAVQITDFAARLTPRGAQCRAVNTSAVRCDGAPINIRRMDARLGDRDDAASIGVAFPVLVDAGAGADMFNGGGVANQGPRISRVDFRGGDGIDLATYSGADRGVRVSNDGVANDGRVTFDEENIDRDVELLTGSRFADEITANGEDSEGGLQRIDGGFGDDVLRDGSSSVKTNFDMGPVADGSDRIIGGSGESSVQYSRRTRAVTVTLNHGGADDGEAGERDEIIGSNEFASGGEAGDAIRAPVGSTGRHNLGGGGGNDTIEGADGPDFLIGGDGQDTINAFGGNDLIRANDGFPDVVGCGSGTDTLELDSRDGFGGDCENRSVGVLRLAPKALRAVTGETASLRLAWRHPRSWRQLRRIELRLYRGDARVGAVAIRPRGERITAGGAVRLARRATRLTRKGKTVSARLAVRLDESLAGQTLRVEVEATDTRGNRQVERNAGSLRVIG